MIDQVVWWEGRGAPLLKRQGRMAGPPAHGAYVCTNTDLVALWRTRGGECLTTFLRPLHIEDEQRPAMNITMLAV